MSQRKVVHVTSVHVWSDTRIFQRMCQGLARRGWHVTLIAPNAPSQIVEGVRVIGIKVPKSRLLRAIIGGLRVVLAARSQDAHAYHLHDPELLLWKWLLRMRGRPVLYDMHEYVPAAIETRPWIPPWVRPFLVRCWKAIERRTLRRSPVILAERSYVEHYPWLANSTVVLNLPDTETLLNVTGDDVEEKTPRIVYVGRVARGRGSLRMLEALLVLRKRGLTVGLDMVGPASEEHRRELEATIARHSLDTVKLHGYMRPLEAWQLAKRAIAGLAVLDREPNYVASFPTKMFEYMALELPVIVSDFPLYREVVERNECGICIDPSDVAALADAIERLITDPAHARELGKNGRRAVLEQYRWDRQLDALESFYFRNMPSPDSNLGVR